MIRPDDTLFRQEAIDQYWNRSDAGAVAAISPSWASGGLLGAAVLLLCAGVGAWLVEVESTSRARAIVRPLSGVQMLTSETRGTVATVVGRAGQPVERGDTVVRLEHGELEAQRLEAEHSVLLLESRYLTYTQSQTRSVDDQQRLLDARLRTLTDQVASQQESVLGFEKRLAANEALRRSGLTSDLIVEDAKEAKAQAVRQLRSLHLQLDETRQELSMLGARRRELTWTWERDLTLAQGRRDAVVRSLEQTVIRAPQRGVIDGVLVRPGDVVEAGQIVGKLIPEGGELSVTSFLSEKDRAHVKVGDHVRLELDQWPHQQFGTIEGRISRISGDLVSSLEIAAAMGTQVQIAEPVYQLAIDLLPDSVSRFGRPLRTGMLGVVRCTVRRERIATLLIAPLRRWLE